MTGSPGVEATVSALLRDVAGSAMRTTDTGSEARRFEQVRREDASRRRRVALGIGACLVAALVIAAVALRPSAGAPPADPDPPGRALRLDEVPARPVAVTPTLLPRSSARVEVTGLTGVEGISAAGSGRLWVLSGDRGTQEWTAQLLAPDHRTVVGTVRFATSPSAWGAPWATTTGEAAVLALPNGGPLPGAERFGDRHAGLLRLDSRTGHVLGFTRVQTATTVEAASDGTVWAVVSPDRVADIDPLTGRRLRTLRTPDLVDRALVQGDRLWLTNQMASPTRAWQVDARTGRVLRVATSADQAIHLPFGTAVVLVYRDGRVLRVDRDGGVTAVQLRLPDPGQTLDAIGTGAGDLWLAAGSSTVLRLDPSTLDLRSAVELPWPGPYAIVRDGSDLLVTDPQDGTVRRVPAAALSPPGS